MRFWKSEPKFSGIIPHEILSQFNTCSDVHCGYVVQCVISLAILKVWQKFKPYFINKLIVEYAKHIQKRKTKKREQLKNIESMKSSLESLYVSTEILGVQFWCSLGRGNWGFSLLSPAPASVFDTRVKFSLFHFFSFLFTGKKILGNHNVI